MFFMSAKVAVKGLEEDQLFHRVRRNVRALREAWALCRKVQAPLRVILASSRFGREIRISTTVRREP